MAEISKGKDNSIATAMSTGITKWVPEKEIKFKNILEKWVKFKQEIIQIN